MQNNAVSKFTTTLLAIPLTTNLRRAELPSCVRIAQGEGGLTSDSVALCHQMRAIDVTRLKSRLGSISEQTMLAVENCVLFSLDIF